MRDVTGLQTLARTDGEGEEVVILFEDEHEVGSANNKEKEKENKNKPREWVLVPANGLELQRMVKVLSFLWKNLFRIDLPIHAKA